MRSGMTGETTEEMTNAMTNETTEEMIDVMIVEMTETKERNDTGWKMTTEESRITSEPSITQYRLITWACHLEGITRLTWRGIRSIPRPRSVGLT